MTDVVDNMVNLARMIANIGSNNCLQSDKPLKNAKLNYQSFEVSDIMPFADSVHQITHIKSSDDELSRFSSDDSFFKQEKRKKESDDFFSKVHSILHKGEKNKKTRNNNNQLTKDDLADIFEDKNFNERKFYKSAEKNFRRGDKKVPRHLMPFWDNRTIVDCDKKQDYNCSLSQNSKINFVQLRKSQDFLWNGKRKNNKNYKKQSTQNVLICDCSSPKNFYQPTQNINENLEFSKNVEIFCREARRPFSSLNLEKENKKMKNEETKNKINLHNSDQNNLKHEDSSQSKLHHNNSVQNKSMYVNSNLNKSHHNNSTQNKSLNEKSNKNKLNHNNSVQNKSMYENSNINESHQNNSIQENSNLHQNNSMYKNSNNKSHQNNLKQNKSIRNDSTRDNSDQNNSIKVMKDKKKILKIKNKKINDPIINFDEFESNDSFEKDDEFHNNNSKNKNELCLEEEAEEEEEEEEDSNSEEDQMHTYKYRNVKKMKINMNQLSDYIDPILEKLEFDDKINKEEKKDFDPIVTNVDDQNIHDPKFYFKGHQKNKKLDELCTFDISEVPNKLFHRKRNPIIQNPNEFYIDESAIDDF